MASSSPDRIFQQGMPWKITVDGAPIWTEVDSFKKGVIRLSALPGELAEIQDALLRPEAAVAAEVNHDEGMFFPTLRFLSMTSDGKQAALRFRIEDDVDNIQRRDAYRIGILLDGRIRSGSEFHQKHDALVRDLSETGIRIRVADADHAFLEKSEVLVAFSSSVLGSMSLKGKVRWLVRLASGYEIGIEFAEPELGEIVRLRNYLWELKRERNLR